MCVSKYVYCTVSASTTGYCDKRLIIVRQNIRFCSLMTDVTKYSCKMNRAMWNRWENNSYSSLQPFYDFMRHTSEKGLWSFKYIFFQLLQLKTKNISDFRHHHTSTGNTDQWSGGDGVKFYVNVSEVTVEWFFLLVGVLLLSNRRFLLWTLASLSEVSPLSLFLSTSSLYL